MRIAAETKVPGGLKLDASEILIQLHGNSEIWVSFITGSSVHCVHVASFHRQRSKLHHAALLGTSSLPFQR